MTSPRPSAPAPGRHALDGGGHPAWCDPRRCVRGSIHIGTAELWYSTIADLEFTLARYQDAGEPEAYLLTLRATATSGTFELVMSDADLRALITAHGRLRNAEVTGSESPDEAAITLRPGVRVAYRDLPSHCTGTPDGTVVEPTPLEVSLGLAFDPPYRVEQGDAVVLWDGDERMEAVWQRPSELRVLPNAVTG